jgi:hypothetical protein
MDMVRRKRARQTSKSDVGMFDMAEIAIPVSREYFIRKELGFTVS